MAFEFTDANFEEKVKEGISVIDFWAEWCGPCRLVGPIIEQLSEEYKDRVLVGKLNVDHHPQTAMNFGIRSIPTLFVMKDGKVVHHHVGTISKARLTAKIEEVISAEVE